MEQVDLSGSCVFHHPYPVAPGGDSGSRVRPYEMLAAFRSLGYEVFEVTGTAAQRRARLEALRRELAHGRSFDFAYSESHTLPPALTEPHHLPTAPFLDARVLRLAHASGIPVGVFYRDVHWRFPHFREHYSLAKRLASLVFYRLEWRTYLSAADHLFLPSLGMRDALPSPAFEGGMSALPPGIDAVPEAPRRARPGLAELRLLYVGGVAPPVYDLGPLLEAARLTQSASVTVCCREAEWRAVRHRYSLPGNVRVVHASGPELASHYAEADATLLFLASDPYLGFAMPVKLFETIQHGLPMIVSGSPEAARFVRAEHTGWAVDSPAEFRALVDGLIADPARLDEAYRQVHAAAPRHTWRVRAAEVAATLTEVRARRGPRSLEGRTG